MTKKGARGGKFPFLNGEEGFFFCSKNIEPLEISAMNFSSTKQLVAGRKVRDII
jgi:hypothetical protein